MIPINTSSTEKNNISEGNLLHTICILLGGVSIITFILLITFSGVPANTKHTNCDNSPLVVNDSFERITLFSAGDAMSHLPQVVSAWDTSCNCFDFTDVFKYLPSIVKKSDVSFINFETTNGGIPYSGFPRFSSPDTVAWFLKSAGFNFFVNANNHSNDKDLAGINKTLDVFDRNNIKHTGVFRDSVERKKNYPVFLKIKGFKLAILNYTYGTNSIETTPPAIVNIIDTNIMKADLKIAADSMPDAVIAIMHWGVEYQREPNYEQKDIAKFLFKNGVDVIVGSHPHVVQPIEFYNFSFENKPKTGLVIWSLGNFISNQREQYRDGGIFVKFDVAKNIYTGKIKIDNVFYIPFWVYKQAAPVKYYLLPISKFENDTTTFAMDSKDKLAFKTFINDVRFHLKRDTLNIKELPVE
ncbi:MAG: CapA family protein [Bacteroidetes bacterium]|nr:CapA family protein [Bacteroidota bacterium]